MEAHWMSNQVIICIGIPGTGKDTQAIRLVEEYGIVQVPSSKLLLAKFAANPDDPDIQREKEFFDTGKLNSGPFVAGVIMEFVRPLAARGVGLVFSGSPRTIHEAEVEFPELLRLYGDRNVRVIHFVLSEEDARARIAGRRFCKANKHPIPVGPEYDALTACPKDGSPLERRALDDAHLQDQRFEEYRNLTEPCLKAALKYGIAVFPVNASKSIEAIHHDIVAVVERHRTPAPAEIPA
jgi:adenylate kinase